MQVKLDCKTNNKSILFESPEPAVIYGHGYIKCMACQSFSKPKKKKNMQDYNTL